MTTSLFSEFQPVTKADWLNEIERSLKGRPLSELNWENAPLSISPFAHATDVELSEPLVSNGATNAWAIGEEITINDKDFKSANQQALEGLIGGVNAPCFVVADFPSESQLRILLDGIELDFISIHFREKTGNRSPLSFLKTFKNYAELVGKNSKLLRGAIHYDPFADGRHDVVAATDLIIWATENLPLFTVIVVNDAVFSENTEGVISALLSRIQAGENYLKRLTVNGLSAELVAQKMAFSCPIGLHYFLEIAQLRAFKLLWGNVLAAYEIVPTLPKIFACTTTENASADAHTTKIKMTTQAMSAVLAGVDVLTLQPSEETDLGRRMARNVSHLLVLESYLDRVADPSAGSFYIENLTTALAEKTWASFINNQ